MHSSENYAALKYQMLHQEKWQYMYLHYLSRISVNTKCLSVKFLLISCCHLKFKVKRDQGIK